MRGRSRAGLRVFAASDRVSLRGTMGKAKTSDRTRDIRCVAKLLRDGGPVDLLAFISAQPAGTNVVLYREYKLRPELVETGNACALPYTVTRICLLPRTLSFRRQGGGATELHSR